MLDQIRIHIYSLWCLLFLFNFSLYGQNTTIYSEVEITCLRNNLDQILNESQLEIDHFKLTDQGIIFLMENSKIETLDDLNISYSILIEDMAAEYEKRKSESNAEIRNGSVVLDNFDTGSMGWYHTNDEMLESINLMKSLFPDKVKLLEIGQTHEGRTIHAIKISDNANEDESDVEGVAYFDALTHAREPNGLFSTLYFMWYLLENHDTDQEMMYLMNNRELYFVPVVNPDGYVYNETTNPNGGGFWRKNRSPNSGSNCLGTDLNRNYGVLWGQSASTDPCNDTYRGGEPFSELESQAVRDLVDDIEPNTALSNHSFGDMIITAQDGTSLIGDNIHREYGSELCPHDYRGYGQVGDILGASGTGATIEYIAGTHECLAYTPEIGSFFWESSENKIWDNAETMFPIFKYLSYTAGEYSSFHDFQLVDSDPIVNGFSNSLEVRLINRGHSFTATNVTVNISCEHPAIELINSSSDYGNILTRNFATNTTSLFDFNIIDDLVPGEAIEFKVNVSQNGGFAYRDSFFIYAGGMNTLFSETAELNLDNWNTNSWEITNVDSYEGQFCISDSPESTYSASVNQRIEMNTSVDLSLSENPYLLFDAKWSLEPNSDFVRVKISTDEGGTWNDIPGAAYTGSSHWQQQKIDLSDYINEDNVRFSFTITSDFGGQSDGFYFDNLNIIDLFEVDFISVDDLEDSKSNIINLYPNPVDNYVFVELIDNELDSYDIELYDVDSKLLFSQQQVNDRVKRIDTSELESGMYYIRVSSEFKNTTLEFIKQ